MNGSGDFFSPTEVGNTTSNTGSYNLPFQVWIMYETFSVFLICLSLYMFLTQLRFACVMGKFFATSSSKSPQSPGSEMISANISTLGPWPKRKNSKKYQKRNGVGQYAQLLRVLCLLGAFFAVLRIAADQLELASYGSERINCKIYQVVVVATYALSYTFIYSALWFRLRIFYYHPIMRHLTSTTVIVFIWVALFCILSSSLLNTSIFIATVQSVDSTYGCILGNTTSVSPTNRYIILTASTVTSQAILLCLFLYPLVKHRSKLRALAAKKALYTPRPPNGSLRPPLRKSHSSLKRQLTPGSVGGYQKQEDRDKSDTQQSRKLRREQRLIAVVWRVLCTAIVCVVSDVIAAVITILLGEHPRVVTNMVFNLNLIVNIISVLCSFGDWRKRLIPCCPGAGQKDDPLRPVAFEKTYKLRGNDDVISDDVFVKSHANHCEKPTSFYPNLFFHDESSTNKGDSLTF